MEYFTIPNLIKNNCNSAQNYNRKILFDIPSYILVHRGKKHLNQSLKPILTCESMLRTQLY